MKNNLKKYVAVIFLFIVVLSGCGGSGNDSDKQDSDIVLAESYDEKPGDRFTRSATISAIYSDGQTAELNSVEESVYSQITEIPTKYNYSNADGGPYLLETTNEEGILSGLDYNTQSGDSIIDDDLEYYTSIEYTTVEGSEDPENISVGDNYSYYQNSTLFNSNTGDEAGYNIENYEYSVLSEEEITVPAGTFNSVKIGFSVSQKELENDIIDTSTGTGYIWIDTTNGFMLKMVIVEGNLTINEYNITASFSGEVLLQSYDLASTKSSKISSQKSLSNYGIKNTSIIFALKKEIRNIRKSI